MSATSRTAKTTLYYWLTTLLGFSLSFTGGILPGVSLSPQIWFALTLGLSSFGCVMLYFSCSGMVGNQKVTTFLKLIYGAVGGCITGLLMYFGPYLLGFYVFYLLYLYWLLLFSALVYFGIKVRLHSRLMAEK